MERPVGGRFNTQIYEEACEWFIECRAGDLDGIARAEFDRWLRKSPEHQSAYLEIAAIWNEGPNLDPATRWDLDTLIAQAAPGDSGNVVALERARRPTRNTAQPVPLRSAANESAGGAPPVVPREVRGKGSGQREAARQAAPGSAPKDLPALVATVGRRRPFAVAASILLVTVAIAIYLLAPRGVYATVLGEQRSLALSDGSTVQLNSLSKIRIEYTEHERTIDLLQGQALFHVAKDTARPFVVNSGQTRVRAVGTQFDVYRRTTDTVITVVEGRVAVLGVPESSTVGTESAGSSTLSPQGAKQGPAQREGGGEVKSANRGSDLAQPKGEGVDSANPGPGTALPGPAGAILLGAGEQIIVTPNAARRTAHANLAGATAWTQRQLVFDSASLTEVAAEFNRYNERKLVIDPTALGALHISGVFSSTDPLSLILFLRDRPGLRVTETPTQIRVEKGP